MAVGIKAKDSPCGQIQHLHWEEGRCLLAGLWLKNQGRENTSEVKEKMETAQINLEMFERKVPPRVWRERAVHTASWSAQSCQGGAELR